MMTQEQAAKYFIVAWVKGWTLRMYLDTVGGGFKSIEWDKAHDIYKWMPSDAGWFMRNQTVRRYIADSFRSLNDKLWDAKDNAERLALAGAIGNLNGSGAKESVSDAQKELSRAKRSESIAKTMGHMHAILYERGSGTNWAVCK